MQSRSDETANKSKPDDNKPIVTATGDSVEGAQGTVESQTDEVNKDDLDITSMGLKKPCDITQGEVEEIFTQVYCYINLLQAISDDNELDHSRFIAFLNQLKHKQSELLRVCDTLKDCSNLAIDLAYTYTVASCYVDLMFTWESGKEMLREELSRLSCECTQQLLELAFNTTSTENLSNDDKTQLIDEMINVLHKFCLLTVIKQAQRLPNLSPFQQKVLETLLKFSKRIDANDLNKSEESDSDSSLNLEELKPLEASGEDANQAARDWSKSVMAELAAGTNSPFKPESVNDRLEMADTNINNNADSNRNNNADTEGAVADTPDGETTPRNLADLEDMMTRLSIESANDDLDDSMADLDDFIRFDQVNPFHEIWKMYVDNQALFSHFKLGSNMKESFCREIPPCWDVMSVLEKSAFEIMKKNLKGERALVDDQFQVLQQVIQACSTEPNDRQLTYLLLQIQDCFSDVTQRAEDLFERCDSEMLTLIDFFNKSDSESDSESSDDNPEPDA